MNEKKTTRHFRGWAVLDSAKNPYLDSVASTKGKSIEAYTIRRGYVWECCVGEDGASCKRVTITVDK